MTTGREGLAPTPEAEAIMHNLEQRFPDGFSLVFWFGEQLSELKSEGHIALQAADFNERIRGFSPLKARLPVEANDKEEIGPNWFEGTKAWWNGLTKFLAGANADETGIWINPGESTMYAYTFVNALQDETPVEVTEQVIPTIMFFDELPTVKNGLRLEHLVGIHNINGETKSLGDEIDKKAQAIFDKHMTALRSGDSEIQVKDSRYLMNGTYFRDAVVDVSRPGIEDQIRNFLIRVGSESQNTTA